MPDRTTCPYCDRVGFVRREHVIKGGKSVTKFYCGSCNRSWESADEAHGQEMRLPPRDGVDRSR